MTFTRVLLAALLLALAGSTLACAPAGSDELVAKSGLEPRFKPGKRAEKDAKQVGNQQAGRPGGGAAGRGKRRPKATSSTSPAAQRAPESESSSPQASPTKGTSTPGSDPGASPTSSPTKPASPSKAATPTSPAAPTSAGPSSVSDPRGDVRGGLGGVPAHVDVVGAAVSGDGGGFEVRIKVAGTLPQVSDGSNVENVVAFFDVDLDGMVDYEAWGHLAEEGWSASARAPGGATFGAASGVTATPSGDTLVLSFPASVVGNARSFQWSAATEYGSLAQVASGATATDYAPDNAGVRFGS